VTVKIRLGWNADSLNYMSLARAAVDGGASAVFVHGRTREARYRQPANWDAIAEIAAALPVPVIGNGDLLFAHEIHQRLTSSGCTAVMTARGALIKPWLFREVERGYWDITADERLEIYRRYVSLALEHWGDDDHGRKRLREFLKWHVGFWCRYAAQRPDGSWPTMQQREGAWAHRSPLESLLARSDDAAIEYVTDELLNGGDFARPPAPAGGATETDLVEAG
jgi:tRNA-dihydrouridine synthase 3